MYHIDKTTLIFDYILSNVYLYIIITHSILYGLWTQYYNSDASDGIIKPNFQIVLHVLETAHNYLSIYIIILYYEPLTHILYTHAYLGIRNLTERAARREKGRVGWWWSLIYYHRCIVVCIHIFSFLLTSEYCSWWKKLFTVSTPHEFHNPSYQ